MLDLPDQSVDNIEATVGATGTTLTVNYPAGRKAASYGNNGNHHLHGMNMGLRTARLGHFSVAFGATDMTVTLLDTSRLFIQGDTIHLELDRAGHDDDEDSPLTHGSDLFPILIDWGAPAAADADGAVLSQAATAASGLATGINGALAVDGEAVFDVPRNVVAAWTGTAVLTVTGEDDAGNVMVESSASGISMTGAKAFKKITGISVSADVTALTVGTGNELGFPVFIGNDLDIIQERLDGATSAGTITVADATDPATATTGDVRGTYLGASVPDGARNFELLAMVRSAGYLGDDQYAG